jgi:hypothetical protein
LDAVAWKLSCPLQLGAAENTDFTVPWKTGLEPENVSNDPLTVTVANFLWVCAEEVGDLRRQGAVLGDRTRL